MPKLAAFLSSINVGGNRIAMADLRAAMERAGFCDVETVVASGNVLFSHDGPPEEIGLQLSTLVEREFGIASFAAVRTRAEVASAISDNPWIADGEEGYVHAHFLEAQPSQAQFDRLVADHGSRGRERLALGPLALYIDYVDGAGNSKLTSAFIERRLGCRGTARNLRSLKRILEKMT